MTWPTSDVITTNTDADTDSPLAARANLLDLMQKFNQMRTHVTAFAQTLLDDADASAALSTLGVSAFAKTILDDADASAALSTLGVSAFAKTILDDADASAALSTLGAVGLTGNETVAGNKTFSGTIIMSGKSIYDANASIAANATTSNIWTAGNYVTLTGTAITFTDFADAPQAGVEVEVYCNAAHTFTNNANIVVDGGVNFVATIGDRIRVRARSTTVFDLTPIRSAGPSSVMVSVGNGHGSTNNKIRRFTNTVLNTGSAITYADSATGGATFTINKAGVYSMHYSDANATAAVNFGISLNSNQLTTSIISITDAHTVGHAANAINVHAMVSATIICGAGDVIRAHTDGNASFTTSIVRFLITGPL